jgi:hypothetical protein
MLSFHSVPQNTVKVDVNSKDKDKPVIAVSFNGPLKQKFDLTLLKDLPKLRALRLDDGWSDKEMKQVGALTGLIELDLYYSKVTSAGLDHLKGLTKLRVLSLPSTVKDDILAKPKGLTELYNVQ